MERESKQVFISYRTSDENMAIEIRDFLEGNGISCWFGNREIPGGADYAKKITAAIRECDLVVLLLSQNAQESWYIRSELEWAVKFKKPIIPVFLEDCNVNSEFGFHLTFSQQIKAYENREAANAKLLASVCDILAKHGHEPQKRRPAPEPQLLSKRMQAEDVPSKPKAASPKSTKGTYGEKVVQETRTVWMKSKLEKVACPLCQSVQVRKGDNADTLRVLYWLMNTLRVALVVGTVLCWALCLLETFVKNGVLPLELAQWEECVRHFPVLCAFLDSEVKLEIQLWLCAALLLILLLAIQKVTSSLESKHAESYRMRLGKADNGIEEIPYSCKFCNEKFKVVVPIRGTYSDDDAKQEDPKETEKAEKQPQ